MPQDILIAVVFSVLLGSVGGYYFRILISMQKKQSIEMDIKKSTLTAKEKAGKIIEEGEKKIQKREETLKKESFERERQTSEKEERLIKKETFLDERQKNIDLNQEALKKESALIQAHQEEAEKTLKKASKALERVAGLDRESAYKELLGVIEDKHKEDLFVRVQKLETAGLEKLRAKARELLTTAIHRYGNAIPSEVVSTIIEIPSEDAKGKIIGKEGRNIRSFEKVAGVDLIIDDTPGVVVISCFDPIRRHIAKNALLRLLEDGRIHPAKIEDRIEEAKKDIDKTIKQKGSDASIECGVLGLDDRVLSVLGRLHFRTSYGQNVLRHSVEMAHIAGMIATELGADVGVAKAGALLHDIGKTADHSVKGTHVEIGKRILEKFGVDKKIIQAMQSHHEEYPYETPESVIVQVADAISGGRPGARRDSTESYLKRLEELEAVANSFEGVTRSYALQAGREIRIFVEPANISDLRARKMAREVALRIEEELKYPGEIKISVMRETRYIEFAR